MKKINTTLSLVVFNLIPLVGVIFFSWNVFSIVLIYWLENIVVGFYNVLKIQKAEGLTLVGSDVSEERKIFINKYSNGMFNRRDTTLFFLVHFGVFTIVHGVFIFVMFFDKNINFFGIVIGFIGLFVSHGISYYSNFIQKEEYKKVSMQKVMFMPYQRIIVLHFVVLFGGFLIDFVGSGVSVIALLVAFKIAADVLSHKAEHKKMI